MPNRAGRVALLTAVTVLLAAGAASGQRPPLRFFTSADGLATDRVAAILRDSHGFLWFGTGGGLSRFDGRSFQTFGPAEGLTHPFVNDLLEERPGRYWVATNGGGLFLFTPRAWSGPPAAARFVRVAVGATPASNRVNVIALDAAGRLWIGTDDGLFLMDSTGAADRIRRIEPQGARLGEPLVQVWALHQQGPATVWAGTSVGLFALLPNGRALHRPIRALQGADHVFALLDQPDRTLLVGHDSGLYLVRFDLDREPDAAIEVLQPWKNPSGSPLSSVRRLMRASDGTIWFTGSGGLSRLDGEFQRVVADSRELEGETRAVAEDASGSIWVARAAGGVARMTRGIAEYDAREGLGEPPYGGILEAKSGELCVTGRRDISVFDGRSFTRIRPAMPADVLGAGRSYGLAHQDRLGEWWIPAGDRLYRFPSVTRVNQLTTTAPKAVYTTRDGLAGSDISRIFEDSRGDIWLNTRIPGRHVVTRWDRASDAFQSYGESHGLRPHNAVADLVEDRSGTIWLSFREGGLARYRRGTFEWVPGFDGLGGVGVLHVDRRGRLWMATFQDVRRIDNTSVEAAADVRAFVPPGLERARVAAFVEDRNGHLYLNTAVGFIRWDMEAERPLLIPVRGQAARQGSSAAFRDRHGALWFAGTGGVSMLMPPETITAAPVTLRIGSLRVNGRPLAIDDLGQIDVPLLALGPDDRRIEIGYFALGRSGEENVRFQYRLEGSASDWSVPSPADSVHFPHLASGTYKLEVRPVGADGASVGNSATVSFRIPTPVWARWWFLLLLGVALIGVGVYFHRRRVARAVELERIRTSIASDLHDDIGANLSQISLLSEMLHGKGVDSDPGNAATLASITELSRESVDTMSDIVWSIDPHKDHLTSLTSRMRRFASELLAARNIHFQMRLAGAEDIGVGADLRRHIYLVFKEALNNVVRHSGATHVDIDLQLAGTDLELKITDDGLGFDPTVITDGNGLRSLQDRARKLGGTLDIQSALGQGTAVTFRVRVRQAHLIM